MDKDDGKPNVTSKAIRSKHTVSNGTLRSWAEAKRVRCVRMGTATGKRLDSMPDILRCLQLPEAQAAAAGQTRSKVINCRVSSQNQKEDLTRQRALLEQRYPGDDVIEDIASGVNFHRRGLVTLLERAIGGGISEVVVLHRDRLARIAFELIECVLRACTCQIVVCDHDDEAASAYSSTNELQEDLLAIVTNFVASNNGKRAAQNRRLRARATEPASESVGAEEDEMDEDEPDSRATSSSSSKTHSQASDTRIQGGHSGPQVADHPDTETGPPAAPRL